MNTRTDVSSRAVRGEAKTTKIDPRGRKVKILATIGPASRSPDMLRRLFRAGADAFRINMSHGEQADHAKAIAAIRELEKEFTRP
ncbi:MAG: pyruvate kinase, partial [Pseudomonadota bacterium]